MPARHLWCLLSVLSTTKPKTSRNSTQNNKQTGKYPWAMGSSGDPVRNATRSPVLPVWGLRLSSMAAALTVYLEIPLLPECEAFSVHSASFQPQRRAPRHHSWPRITAFFILCLKMKLKWNWTYLISSVFCVRSIKHTGLDLQEIFAFVNWVKRSSQS